MDPVTFLTAHATALLIIAAVAVIGVMYWKDHKKPADPTAPVAVGGMAQSIAPVVTGMPAVDKIIATVVSSKLGQDLNIAHADVERMFWMDVLVVLQKKLAGNTAATNAAQIIQMELVKAAGTINVASQSAATPPPPAPSPPLVNPTPAPAPKPAPPAA